MSIFTEQYKKKKPSKLIKVSDAGKFIEIDIYSKPASKKSYAFWVLGLQQFDELKENEIQAALGGMVNLMSKLICLSTCNADGVLIFNLDEDMDALSELDDPIIFEKLFNCACEANGVMALGESISASFRKITDVFDNLDEAFAENKNGAKKAPRKKRRKAS